MTATIHGITRTFTERELCIEVVFDAFAKHGALDILPMIPTETLSYFIAVERMTGEQVYAACCRTHAES